MQIKAGATLLALVMMLSLGTAGLAADVTTLPEEGETTYEVLATPKAQKGEGALYADSVYTSYGVYEYSVEDEPVRLGVTIGVDGAGAEKLGSLAALDVKPMTAGAAVNTIAYDYTVAKDGQFATLMLTMDVGYGEGSRDVTDTITLTLRDGELVIAPLNGTLVVQDEEQG